MEELLLNILDYERDIYDDIMSIVRYKPKSNEELKEVVNLWIKDRDEGIKRYGCIGVWDVSDITSMEGLFRVNWYMINDFNDDISLWDTSNVTDMSEMFCGCKSIYSYAPRVPVYQISRNRYPCLS